MDLNTVDVYAGIVSAIAGVATFALAVLEIRERRRRRVRDAAREHLAATSGTRATTRTDVDRPYHPVDPTWVTARDSWRRHDGNRWYARLAIVAVVVLIGGLGAWAWPEPWQWLGSKWAQRHDGGQLVIRNGYSGLCLDNFAFRSDEGDDVVQWTCNRKPNQMWRWRGEGSLQSVSSELCLDAFDFGATNGTRVVQVRCNDQKNQQWVESKDARGNPTLRGVHSGLCLDDFGHETKDGANVVMWECNNRPNQVWYVLPAD
jgi:hypothetical protein